MTTPANRNQPGHEQWPELEIDPKIAAFLKPLRAIEPVLLDTTKPARPAAPTPAGRRGSRRRWLTVVPLTALTLAGTAGALFVSYRTTLTPTGHVNREHSGARASWAECQHMQGRPAEVAREFFTQHGYTITWRATTPQDLTRVVPQPPPGDILIAIAAASPASKHLILQTRGSGDPLAKHPLVPASSC